MNIALSNPASLGIEGGRFIGGSQEWYPEFWQRMSGCGPTAASNLVWYMTQQGKAPLCDVGAADLTSFIRLMVEMFSHITPGMGGVNSEKMFTKGLLSYGKAHGMTLNTTFLSIPKKPCNGPELVAVDAFLVKSLKRDVPVAFLNLSNGTLTNLDNWHWVTIIEWTSETMRATISDQGRTVVIDLARWLETTVLGGTLVHPC